MPARTVFGRTHAVALIPTAQRGGGNAEALSDDTDCEQRFVRVGAPGLLRSRQPRQDMTPGPGNSPFNAKSMQNLVFLSSLWVLAAL